VSTCVQDINDLKDACLEAPRSVDQASQQGEPTAAAPSSLSSSTSASTSSESAPAADDGFPEDYPADAPEAFGIGEAAVTGVQRRLLQLFGSEEDVEPISQDHCCAPDNALPGCDATKELDFDDPSKILGLLLVDSSTVKRPLFTRDKVVVGEYDRDFDVYCRFEHLKRTAVKNSPKTSENWLGAQRWRWLVFVAIYSPLGPVSFGIASIFSFFVTTFNIGGRNVCTASPCLSCAACMLFYKTV
jgi:hypothetical protein